MKEKQKSHKERKAKKQGKNMAEKGISSIVLIITFIILSVIACVSIVLVVKYKDVLLSPASTNETSKEARREPNAKEKQARFNDIKLGQTVTYIPNTDAKFNLVAYKGVNNGNIIDMSSEKNLIWKVWKKTEDSILITPDTPTKNRIKLEGADGYNNAVQAINAYCRKYYSDPDNGIYARSINMNDLEASLTDTGIGVKKYYSKKNYNMKITTESLKSYPGIYPKETSNEIEESDSPLSDEYAPWESVAGNETSKNDGAMVYKNGYKQTYYYFSNSDIKEHKYFDETTEDLFFSNGGYGDGFWIASRCVCIYTNRVGFDIRYVHSNGGLYSYVMSYTDGNNSYNTLALRPVVSIPKSKILQYEIY